MPKTRVAHGSLHVHTCVQACSGSMLDPFGTNHGDRGLTTPVGKAALRSLGTQWPDAHRVPSELPGAWGGQPLHGEKSGRKPRPARLGTCTTSDSPMCLSKLYRKEGKSAYEHGRDTDTRHHRAHPLDIPVSGTPHTLFHLTLPGALGGAPSPFFQTRKLRG